MLTKNQVAYYQVLVVVSIFVACTSVVVALTAILEYQNHMATHEHVEQRSSHTRTIVVEKKIVVEAPKRRRRFRGGSGNRRGRRFKGGTYRSTSRIVGKHQK